MKKTILMSLLFVTLFFGFVSVPVDTFAQTPPTNNGGCTAPNNFGELFTYAVCLLTRFVVPFLFALALVLFLVGIVKYVKGGDNEEAREAGRGLMLFGIIALFVMVSVWGLVRILFNSIFEGSSQNWEMPSLPPQSTTPFR